MSTLRSFISQTDTEKLAHAFIPSRLDYHNALYAGTPKQPISRLQLIQNSVAGVLTQTRFDHITPVLESHYWLLIQNRITFKIFLLVHKALNNSAPKNISDLFTPNSPTRTLRSSGEGLLVLPKVKSESGEGAFCDCGPFLT